MKGAAAASRPALLAPHSHNLLPPPACSDKPVIKKTLVDLQGAPFGVFAAARRLWATGDCVRSPGPMQFRGIGGDLATITLSLEVNGGQPLLLCSPPTEDEEAVPPANGPPAANGATPAKAPTA